MSKGENEITRNRRAYHDYEVLETFEAGMSLLGTEIKSMRANGASLQEAYVRVVKDEVWLIGCSIRPYQFGNVHNHEERRDRKLLLHKREIALLKTATQEKGLTIVPLGIYLKRGRAKIKIATARGKKKTDKRAALKERDEKRRIAKELKKHV